jgi:hypothetical protein
MNCWLERFLNDWKFSNEMTTKWYEWFYNVLGWNIVWYTEYHYDPHWAKINE